MSALMTLRETLPLRQRLAMAYAPPGAEALLGLLAFDTRLAAILRQAREPMLAQIKFAWWRENLGTDGSGWPDGEPLLAALRGWQGQHAPLIALLDAWEGMTGDAPLPAAVFADLAEARGGAFAALAGEGAGEQALRMGRNWALADLAGRVRDATERSAARDLALRQDWRGARLPRGLRPLAVLHALAARDLRRGGDHDRVSPMAMLAALRAGLIGR